MAKAARLPTSFPVPLGRFLASLHGTDDAVWGKLLQLDHGRENHTAQEWRSLLDSKRNAPVR